MAQESGLSASAPHGGWTSAGGDGAPAGAPGQPWGPATAEPPALTTASMGMRLLARLVDGLLVVLALAVVVVPLIAWTVSTEDPVTGDPAVLPTVLTVLVAYVLAPLGAAAYWVVLTGRGATLGKRWLGLRVVRRETGRPPGFGWSALRYVVEVGVSFVPLLGPALLYLSPLFDSSGRRQGWHDLAAGTRVVDVRRPGTLVR